MMIPNGRGRLFQHRRRPGTRCNQGAVGEFSLAPMWRVALPAMLAAVPIHSLVDVDNLEFPGTVRHVPAARIRGGRAPTGECDMPGSIPADEELAACTG